TAFHLMGSWDLVEGRANAADKKGLPDEKLGWVFFPEVKGGKGKANDLFASLDGWLVTKEAPKDTIDFMRCWPTKVGPLQRCFWWWSGSISVSTWRFSSQAGRGWVTMCSKRQKSTKPPAGRAP